MQRRSLNTPETPPLYLRALKFRSDALLATVPALSPSLSLSRGIAHTYITFSSSSGEFSESPLLPG